MLEVGVPWPAALAVMLALVQCQPVQAPAPEPEAPGESVGFANPELLVDTAWLAEHLDDPDVRVVDTRSAEDYAAGHIPGAVHIPRSETYDPDREPGMVGTPEQIAKLFGDKGIDEYAHVVVYDQGRSTAAARVFWTLEYYGHPRVSVLNGGMTKWTGEGRELSTDVPDVAPVTFTARANPETLSTKDLILDELDDPSAVMLDVRSDEEYTGETVRAERGGHIPGAVHIEWMENFTRDDVPVFKSALELAGMYEEAGVTRDKRVHAY